MFTIKPPKPGMTLTGASFAGADRFLVEYSELPTPQHPHAASLLALVDVNTGKVVETLEPPPKAGIPACAASGNEFLFLRSGKSGQAQAIELTP